VAIPSPTADVGVAQAGAGQAQQSEAVDAGSASAASLGITGSPATNGAADVDQIDLGFHYGRRVARFRRGAGRAETPIEA
jgi:hypothetical protein